MGRRSRRATHAPGVNHTAGRTNELERELIREWTGIMDDNLAKGHIPYSSFTPQEWAERIRKYGYTTFNVVMEQVLDTAYDSYKELKQEAKQHATPIKRCIFVRDYHSQIGRLLGAWITYDRVERV